MSIQTVCPVCLSKNSSTFMKVQSQLSSRRDYTLARCPQCTHVFLVEMPTAEELSEFYSSTYQPYNMSCSSEGSRNNLRAKLHAFVYGKGAVTRILCRPMQWLLPNYPEYVPNGLLLDIGCGAGTIMQEQKHLGWICEGLDMEPSVKELLERMGMHVHLGDAATLLKTLPESRYDAVLSCHSLEHFADPREVVASVRRILKPGGQFVVTVPNAQSWLARRYEQAWYAQECPAHLQIFSKRSLKVLLSQTGFQVTRVFCSEISANFLKLHSASHKSTSCGLALKLAAEFCTRCANYLNQGDVVTIHARKKN